MGITAELIIFGLLAAGANVLGGLLLISAGAHRWGERALKYLVALGAGFMLAAIFLEIVPQTVSIWLMSVNAQVLATPEIIAETILPPMTLLLAGYLVIQFFEHTLTPHFHFGEETHTEAVLRPHAAYTAIGALTIHTFFDGVTIGAAFLHDFTFGMLIFVAVLLHKLPEGFTSASIILASGRSRRAALWATLAIGIATFFGVLSVLALSARVPAIVKFALPFSAGVTLYVAASDLIPEVNHKEARNPVVSLVVFAGVAIFYVLHQLFEG